MNTAQVVTIVVSVACSLLGNFIIIALAGRRWTTEIEVRLGKGDEKFEEFSREIEGMREEFRSAVEGRADKTDVIKIQEELRAGLLSIHRELVGNQGTGGILQRLDWLSEQVRTVDQRITDSRHLSSNHMTALLGASELSQGRVNAQLERRLLLLEESIRFGGPARRFTDPELLRGPGGG